MVANFTLQVWAILFTHYHSFQTESKPPLNPTEASPQLLAAIITVLHCTNTTTQEPSVPQFTPAQQQDDGSDPERSPLSSSVEDDSNLGPRLKKSVEDLNQGRTEIIPSNFFRHTPRNISR